MTTMLRILAIFVVALKSCQPCGIATHTEVIERALANYDNDAFGPGEVLRILREHQGSFQAGAPYPDTFYNSLCKEGSFHSQSEDIHWGEYQRVAWNYFRKTYPDPIGNVNAERLFAFILGLTSHQVADVSWHSLGGLKEGLIEMLSQTSFNGNFGAAHDYADFVGDIIGIMEWNTSYIDQWYVPTKDLHNIFIEYYGDDKGISQNLLSSCTLMLLAGRIAEQELGALLYPVEVIRAPVFLDEIQDYYMGGINDMAAWTQIVWDNSITMATKGTEFCHIERNPLNIYCNGTQSHQVLKSFGEYPAEEIKAKKIRFFDRLKEDVGIDDLNGLAKELIEVEETENGVFFNAKSRPRLNPYQEAQDPDILPDFAFIGSKPFGNLGQALHVADINDDGLEDLIIGTPGVIEPGQRSQGCIAIITDIESIMKDNTMIDISEMPSICPDEHYARFGHSIETFQAEDGSFKIAVGAPRSGTESNAYNGCIFIYDQELELQEKICNDPEEAGNLGSNLKTLEKETLVASAIFAQVSGSRQAGAIHAMNAKSFLGSSPYSWTGNSIEKLDNDHLAISSHLAKVGEVNTMGEVKIIDNDFNEVTTIFNPDLYSDQFGFALIATNLTIDGQSRPCLMVGAPVSTIGFHTNAGAVYIFDSQTFEYIGKMHSDRALGRFGRSFAQTQDNLYIGAPRYHEEANALKEEGAVFAMSKSKDLPIGEITANCPDVSKAPCLDHWTSMKITPPNGATRTLFGYQIRTMKRGQDDYLVISAPRNSDFVNQGGAVYLYRNIQSNSYF